MTFESTGAPINSFDPEKSHSASQLPKIRHFHHLSETKCTCQSAEIFLPTDVALADGKLSFPWALYKIICKRKSYNTKLVAIRFGKLRDCQLSTMSYFKYSSTFKQVTRLHTFASSNLRKCLYYATDAMDFYRRGHERQKNSAT